MYYGSIVGVAPCRDDSNYLNIVNTSYPLYYQNSDLGFKAPVPNQNPYSFGQSHTFKNEENFISAPVQTTIEKKRGIGLLLQNEPNGELSIVDFQKNGAADRNGRLLRGDVLVLVEGVSVRGLTARAVATMIGSVPETHVRLSVRTGLGSDAPLRHVHVRFDDSNIADASTTSNATFSSPTKISTSLRVSPAKKSPAPLQQGLAFQNQNRPLPNMSSLNISKSTLSSSAQKDENCPPLSQRPQVSKPKPSHPIFGPYFAEEKGGTAGSIFATNRGETREIDDLDNPDPKVYETASAWSTNGVRTHQSQRGQTFSPDIPDLSVSSPILQSPNNMHPENVKASLAPNLRETAQNQQHAETLQNPHHPMHDQFETQYHLSQEQQQQPQHQQPQHQPESKEEIKSFSQPPQQQQHAEDIYQSQQSQKTNLPSSTPASQNPASFPKESPLPVPLSKKSLDFSNKSKFGNSLKPSGVNNEINGRKIGKLPKFDPASMFQSQNSSKNEKDNGSSNEENQKNINAEDDSKLKFGSALSTSMNTEIYRPTEQEWPVNTQNSVQSTQKEQIELFQRESNHHNSPPKSSIKPIDRPQKNELNNIIEHSSHVSSSENTKLSKLVLPSTQAAEQASSPFDSKSTTSEDTKLSNSANLPAHAVQAALASTTISIPQEEETKCRCVIS